MISVTVFRLDIDGNVDGSGVYDLREFDSLDTAAASIRNHWLPYTPRTEGRNKVKAILKLLKTHHVDSVKTNGVEILAGDKVNN